MEHRNGERTRISLSASLQRGGDPLGRFTTRDVSRTGLSLYGNVSNLANNSIITVLIDLIRDNRIITQHYKALVIHQHQGSVGLMWVDDDINLQELLPGDAVQADWSPRMPRHFQHSNPAWEALS